MCRVAGFAAGTVSFQGLGSWDCEGLVCAGVQVELVAAVACIACDVVGLKVPFSLGRCLDGAAAPWTVRDHCGGSSSAGRLGSIVSCFWIFKNGLRDCWNSFTLVIVCLVLFGVARRLLPCPCLSRSGMLCLWRVWCCNCLGLG